MGAGYQLVPASWCWHWSFLQPIFASAFIIHFESSQQIRCWLWCGCYWHRHTLGFSSLWKIYISIFWTILDQLSVWSRASLLVGTSLWLITGRRVPRVFITKRHCRELNKWISADTHTFTLSAKSYNNHPYRHIYIAPSFIDFPQYQYQCHPIYHQSITHVRYHITQVWYHVLHQFWSPKHPISHPNNLLISFL